MEWNAWILVCVLLLAGCGSAQQDAASLTSSATTVTPGTLSSGPAVPSSLAPATATAAAAALTRSATDPGPTVAAGKSSVNVTSTPSPPSSPFPDPENRTQLLTPASSNQSSTPHLHLNPTPLHPAGTPGDVPTSAALPSTSVPQSDQGTPTVIPSFTPPSASEPPNATSAPRTSQPAASSTGFPQGASTTVTTPKPTRPEERPETSGVTRPATTAAAPTSTSTQAKPHTNGPSQLNVGGDTTILRHTPTPDPLLVGLVSAFIITAIVLTLLVFLKLRRRNSRPEFHRLQDLPMDDMEDTPLSMYSY